jgi:hypothetical protein
MFRAALLASVAFSTFDSSFLGTGVTLSADKRTASFSNVAFQSTKGTVGRSTGKHYFEVTFAGGAGGFEAGLCKAPTRRPTR